MLKQPDKAKQVYSRFVLQKQDKPDQKAQTVMNHQTFRCFKAFFAASTVTDMCSLLMPALGHCLLTF